MGILPAPLRNAANAATVRLDLVSNPSKPSTYVRVLIYCLHTCCSLLYCMSAKTTLARDAGHDGSTETWELGSVHKLCQSFRRWMHFLRPFDAYWLDTMFPLHPSLHGDYGSKMSFLHLFLKCCRFGSLYPSVYPTFLSVLFKVSPTSMSQAILTRPSLSLFS